MNPNNKVSTSYEVRGNIKLSAEDSSLLDRFSSNSDDEYQILRYQHDPSCVDINDVLEKYLRCSDKIIGMMDGSVSDRDLFSNPEIQNEEAPDVVVWLDKSARPVSWLASELWQDFAKDGSVKPEYLYRNIDRVDWFIRQGYSPTESESRLGPSDFDIDKVPPEEIDRVRALSVIGSLDQDNWQADVWQKPNRLDGKKILIIDEVKNKGGSLSIAQQVFQKAYPTAKVSGAYFWERGENPLVDNVHETQIESVPVWYSANNVFGRGVGDRDQEYYDLLPNTDENFKRKLGNFVLSAPHHKPESLEMIPDEKAIMLRDDFRHLAESYRDGRVLRVPYIRRSEDDTKAILDSQSVDYKTLRQYNGLKTIVKRKKA